MAVRAALLAGLCALPVTAAGEEVQPCAWYAAAEYLAEPWQDHTRVFFDGAVRIALLDTVEPAAGAYRLLVLAPPYGPTGERSCSVIGVDGGGFSGFDFAALSVARDGPGVTLTAPVTALRDGDFAQAFLSVTLDPVAGIVTTRLAP